MEVGAQYKRIMWHGFWRLPAAPPNLQPMTASPGQAQMRESWDRRIRRAEHLAAEGGPSTSLIGFYSHLLRGQKAIFESLNGNRRKPSGFLERDLDLVMDGATTLLHEVVTHGSDRLAADARTWLDTSQPDFASRVLAHWRHPSEIDFFPKAILQPYGQWLVEAAMQPGDRDLAPADNRCPFCGGKPQLSVLDATSDSMTTEGGGRSLLCATCLNAWKFPRVQCAHCGEADEHKLGYYRAAALAHLRVETCDTCNHYLKTVDLTQLGLAVPLVDEVAGAPLDLWAGEHGFRKIELNLVGL